MAKISLSGQEKPIEFIVGWYEDQVQAINDFKNKVINSIFDPRPLPGIHKKFASLTLEEINTYFDDNKTELNHLVCLNLISAIEAFLRVDYHKRVAKRDKWKLTQLFREIDYNQEYKMSLEDDIIKIWKTIKKHKAFSDFLGLLKYRHWLAHGRYWTPKFGRNYSFDDACQIAEDVFKVVSKQN